MSVASGSAESGSKSVGNAPGTAIGVAEKGSVQQMHSAYPGSRDERRSVEIKDYEVGSQRLPSPATSAKDTSKPALHPALYVISWIAMSSSVILFNKYLLDAKKKLFPIFLTSWHLGFASIMTQLLARTTTLLDGRKRVKMTGRMYLRAIVPIGFFFSLSLICGNKTYMYLSVSFIQMLKASSAIATTPVAVLLTTWALGLAPANLRILLNVSIIVAGVIIASIGEIHFVLIGFIYQIGGICFEATRLVMVQRLLSSPEYKLDPLVSLYYFAPICAILNGLVAMVVEMPDMSFEHFQKVGAATLLLNAVVAFLLNVTVVFLIGKTSSLVLTLCGVLKDVLLVTLSCVVFGSPVTPLQIFGYTIALGGLVTYQLGVATIKEYMGQAALKWGEYGAMNPRRKRIITLLGIVAIVLGVFELMKDVTSTSGYIAARHLAGSSFAGLKQA
ncbi:hypothetical protein KEM54_006780 [Ascosphaera aggregata]|nr:hypothetical protein KEM54_006780 [Ascosphaera aggregata]